MHPVRISVVACVLVTSRDSVSQASAQAAVANSMALFVMESLLQTGKGTSVPSNCQFMFCPREYCGRLATPDVKSSEYSTILGRELIPEVGVIDGLLMGC